MQKPIDSPSTALSTSIRGVNIAVFGIPLTQAIGFKGFRRSPVSLRPELVIGKHTAAGHRGFAIIFLTKDELSKSQSPTLLLIVNIFKGHLALVLISSVIFLFVCAALWGLADYFDRSDLWRRRR